MERIASFQVNHNTLLPGVYLSRESETTYTLDVRFVRPNMGMELSTKVMHTIEHLGATFLRNSKYKDSVIYWGPQGCRTGFYAIFEKSLPILDAYALIKEFFDSTDTFTEVPGNTKIECGNYTDLDNDLIVTKQFMRQYAQSLPSNPTLVMFNYT